jgi:two-component system response regulator AtoC
MTQMLAVLDRVATSPRSPVLFIGETGVGKEVLARRVHVLRGQPDSPFVHVNCAALPETMAESELFGHERGAFTDAKAARRGLVELASGGVLFLDEVGELSLPLQAKLLTFLDSGRFRRLGGTHEQTSTARILAATHKDPEAEVRKGTFRQDLYFRLNVFRIDIPPLRARPEDVLPLAEGLLESLRQELGRRDVTLGKAAKARLLAYPFPGNARELRNVLERALVLEPGPELQVAHLSAPTGGGAAANDAFTVSEVLPMDDVERRYARWALQRHGGTRTDVARALGLSYPTLAKRLDEQT